MKRIFQTVSLIFGILFGFQNCSMPEIKQPKFERNSKEVMNELKALSNFEDTGTRCRANSFKDEINNFLNVQLVNGGNLSEDDIELNNLGKEALKIVVNSIENEVDYDKFQVISIFQRKVSDRLIIALQNHSSIN